MRHGTVAQRHTKRCPRDAEGRLVPHRCKGAWSYLIDLPRAADGKRRQISKSGFPTRAAAMSALKEQVALLASDVGTHTITVGDYLDQWLASKHSLKPSTRSHYADAIRLYLRPHIGSLCLLELRADHLDRLYGAIKIGARGRPLSTSSVRRVHACLSSALNTAVKRRLIPYNPAMHVELPPEAPRRPTPWTADDCRTFLASAASDPLHAMYHLLLVTGMRRGEAIGLTWTHVDLANGVVKIVEQVTEVRGVPTRGTPKTRRSTRVVPIDRLTVESLTNHREMQRAERALHGAKFSSEQPVFTREDGSVLRPEYVTRHFQLLARRAQLPAIRLHDLRHTNASLALEAGVDIKVVSERLGHATTAITSDLYTHVASSVSRAAANRIAALVSAQPTATTEHSSAADTTPAEVSELLARKHEDRPEGRSDVA
jgi:integrase